MRILYFHQYFSTPNGSVGTRSYEFSKRLVELGHKVTIICGSYWIADTGLKNKFKNGIRSGSVSGIDVIEIDQNFSNSDGKIKRLFKFIKFSFIAAKISINLKYDFIFATSTPLTIGLPAIFLKIINRNIPFVFEVRDLWPELPKAAGFITNPIVLKLLGVLEDKIYHYSDGCVGLAPGIVDGIRKKVPKKPIIMIPNGCDSHLIQDGISKKEKNEFVVSFTGAHGLANGLEYLMDVARALKDKSHDDIIIQFIGDGMVKNKLLRIAKSDNLSNCQFLDPMPKKILFTHMKENVDAGLMILKNVPAFYNGTSPNKFFDYLSLGLPIINNYPGWIADIIKKNKCGIVVPPNDPETLASILIKLKERPNLLKKMSRNAKILARNNFDRNKLANQFVDFIQTF